MQIAIINSNWFENLNLLVLSTTFKHGKYDD